MPSSSSSSTATPHLEGAAIVSVVRSAQLLPHSRFVLFVASVTPRVPAASRGIYQHKPTRFVKICGGKRKGKTRKIIHKNWTFSVDFALVLLLFYFPSSIFCFSLCFFLFGNPLFFALSGIFFSSKFPPSTHTQLIFVLTLFPLLSTHAHPH